MKFFVRITIGIMAAISIAACSFSDFDEVYVPEQPSGYLSLLSAYEDGRQVKSIEDGSKRTTVIFEGGYALSFANTEINFIDRRKSGKPTVAYSEEKGKWTVDGKYITTTEHVSRSRDKSIPVYAYYDYNTIHVYLSNDDVLDFPYIPNPYGEIRDFEMPKVYLNNISGGIHKEYYTSGTFKLEDPDNAYSTVDKIECAMQIKGRGNSSWGMPKQPYRVKLESKQSVLGMPANRDWVFLNNYSDKSLLRNIVAMELSRIVGMTWTPRCTNIELYLNNEYRGVYCLIEHKEVAKDKVNIDVVKPEDEDITGDYYLEIESTTDEPTYFSTSKGVPMQFKDPEYPTEEQLKYIKDYFNNFEKALYGSNSKDPVNGYAKYIDVDSFVNYFIVEELVKNVDGTIFKSDFLTKERDKKLKFYHLWDFDLTMGNCNYIGAAGNGPEGWLIKNARWYCMLFQDPAFRKKVQDKWNEVYSDLERVPDFIDKCVAEMGNAPTRNFKKWDILNVAVWPNVVVPGSYEGEIEYLKDYYTQRLEWMNNAISKFVTK